MTAPRQLAPFTGFTEEEVMELCARYRMEYDDVAEWYDGYVISNRIPPEKREEYREGKYEGHKIAIYSPLSVVEAMRTGFIRNYWNKTETYEALAEYIRKDYDGLKDAVALLMDGGGLRIDTSSYQNDMTTFHSRDDILCTYRECGYNVFLKGEVMCDSEILSCESVSDNYDFCVAVSEKQAEKIGIHIGDINI